MQGVRRILWAIKKNKIMSTCLYWSIVPKEPSESSLYSLKRIMAKRLGSMDGSCSESLGVVDSSLIPFLEGLIDGDTTVNRDIAQDAQSLIDAIKKYGKVQLTIHS